MTDVLAALTSPLDAGQLAGLFWHFFILSFFAIGGVITTAPGMHRYVAVEHQWISDAQFSASIAIAQAAPGPNVLFVAVIGWTVAGPLGTIVTMTGIMLPSTVLSLAASRWGTRRRETRAMRSFTTGMTPITIGLLGRHRLDPGSAVPHGAGTPPGRRGADRHHLLRHAAHAAEPDVAGGDRRGGRRARLGLTAAAPRQRVPKMRSPASPRPGTM